MTTMCGSINREKEDNHLSAKREHQAAAKAATNLMVPVARSRNMAAIRGKDTKPEIIVRKYLWSRGFRYRLNHRRLPGKPDVVLRKYRTCIFVNGCFWHGHNIQLESDNLPDAVSSECCKIPHTNRKFWVTKMMRNKNRDAEVQKKLAAMGWHSVVVWECQLKPGVREQTLESLAFTLNHIFLENHTVKRYKLSDNSEYSMVAEEFSPNEHKDER